MSCVPIAPSKTKDPLRQAPARNSILFIVPWKGVGRLRFRTRILCPSCRRFGIDETIGMDLGSRAGPGLLATVESAILRQRRQPGAPPMPRLTVATETWASAALAGAALTFPETRSASSSAASSAGTRPLQRCLPDLGLRLAPSEWVARQRQPVRPLFTLAELRALHVRACKPLALLEPAYNEAGEWRTSNAPPTREGSIYLPPALIAREIALLIDRCAAGPPPVQSPFVWLASFHDRFDRIRPFALAQWPRGLRLMLGLALVRSEASARGDRRRATFAAYRQARLARRRAAISRRWPTSSHAASRATSKRPASRVRPPSFRSPRSATNGLSLAALRKAVTRGRSCAMSTSARASTSTARVAARRLSRANCCGETVEERRADRRRQDRKERDPDEDRAT